MTELSDFLKTANSEQIAILKKIKILALKEAAVEKAWQKEVNEYNDAVAQEYRVWPRQIADSILRDEYDSQRRQLDSLSRETDDKMLQLQGEMKKLCLIAVKKYNMGHVGFIQRSYQALFKKPISL